MGKDNSLKKTIIIYFLSNTKVLWGILFGFTLMFSLILFPHTSTSKYSYRLGDIAKRDIKAPKDFFIEDKEATELNRDLAVKSVLNVYDHNTNLANELTQRIRTVFGEYRAIFAAKPKVPVPVDATSQEKRVESPPPLLKHLPMPWSGLKRIYLKNNWG